SPRFRIAIRCSKGTYIRSLVADLGTELGCGAHLAELRRTRSGRFAIAQAIPMDRVAQITAAELVALVDATELPQIQIDEPTIHAVRSGIQLQEEALPCTGM